MFTKRTYRKRNKPKQSNWLESGEQSNEKPFFSPVQTKLNIGKPGDVHEKEADKTADEVVNKTSDQPNVQKMGDEQEEVQTKALASSITPLVQKQEDKKEEESVQKQEEEPVQAKEEEEESVQAKEKEEEPVQAKEEEEEPVQAKEEEEESVQAQEEEEEPVQAKEEEEEAVQAKEEEEPVQAKEAAKTKLQRAEEKEMQGKEAAKSSVKPSMESTLRSKKGSGSKMDSNTKTDMEIGFGVDFSGVNIHTDSKSQEMSDEIGAQAFTHGNDIYFNQGKYNPQSKEGKHLLAHELTHTIQQGKNKSAVDQSVQRKGKAFRYTPPKSVKRSIKQIQMIVGSTPDGVYGPKTRDDVIRYQKRMKKLKKYNDTIDGKWGKNTEAAHKFMAMPRSLSAAEGYNCTGFVLKQWRPIFLRETLRIYSRFKRLKKASDKCGPFEYKIWIWLMKVEQVNTRTGLSIGKWVDFHTVGGRTHKDGSGPKQVMSKNGPRPLEGPGTPLSFEPKSGPVIGANGKPVPHNKWILTNKKLFAFCTKKLP